MNRAMLAASIIADLYKGYVPPSDRVIRAILRMINRTVKP